MKKQTIIFSLFLSLTLLSLTAQAADFQINGAATVTVASADGSATKTYTFHFTAPQECFRVSYITELRGEYKTLQEAIDNVPNGGTITMLCDVALEETNKLAVSSEGEGAILDREISYTINLGGHTLSPKNSVGILLNMRAGTVTIKNGAIDGGEVGTPIQFYDSPDTGILDKTLTLDGLTVTGTYAVTIPSGKLNILSGTYSGIYTVFNVVADGSVVITSGHFSCLYSIIGLNYYGCLATYQPTDPTGKKSGSISLAPGSTASVSNWLNDAQDVTVTSSNTVFVGEQTGALTPGTAGSVTFPVTTSGIAAGTALTLNGAPAGVTLDAVTTTGNSTTITIRTTTATPQGAYSLTLTAGGIPSNTFYLSVVLPLGRRGASIGLHIQR